jgi:hypothetical protein
VSIASWRESSTCGFEDVALDLHDKIPFGATSGGALPALSSRADAWEFSVTARVDAELCTDVRWHWQCWNCSGRRHGDTELSEKAAADSRNYS